jgi:hypothetical protein
MTLDKTATSAVQRVLDDLVASGREIGVQVAAYLHNELIVDAWAGMAPAAGYERMRSAGRSRSTWRH